MKLERQHFLLSYFITLSVGPGGVELTRNSPMLNQLSRRCAVGSSSLSRWLKTVLSLTGIDSTVYTGHSFRSASTSKASRLGVPLDTILSTADWRNSGTFFKFYKDDVAPCNLFANAVLENP